MGAPLFNNGQFVELLKFSPQKAFEYRLETQWTPIPETYWAPGHEVKLDTSKNDVKNEELPSVTSETDKKPQEDGKDEDLGKTGGEIDPPKTETDENSSKIDNEPPKNEGNTTETPTREKMVSLLKDKGIKFFAGAKDDKLLEICKNNNLL